MNTAQISKTTDLIQQANSIAIIPHRNPDGDAMGSCLALFHFLKKTKMNVFVVAPNEFPDFLGWLPSADQTLIFENNLETTTALLQKCDLIFTLDFNAFHRTGDAMSFVLKELTCDIIMIDHHEAPDDYASVMYSDPAMSSTCEMVYHFISYLDGLSLLDNQIATCIYTGLITDTGSFKYASTTASTMRVAANLMDVGIDTSAIYTSLFDNNSPNRLQILGVALQNLKLFPEYKTSYTSLSQDELDQLNYKKGDTEGIVNYGLSIKDVIFTAFFAENRTENIIKISFRSLGDFDVNQFARLYFNGGGHKNAAGGKSALSLQETLTRFEQIIKTIDVN